MLLPDMMLEQKSVQLEKSDFKYLITIEKGVYNWFLTFFVLFYYLINGPIDKRLLIYD